MFHVLWFAWTALLLIVCLLGVALVGRALLLVLDIRDVPLRSPEGVAAGALLGTAAWTLACGWLSYAGLPMRVAAPLVLGSAVVLVGAAVRRGGWAVLAPAARSAPLGVLTGLAVAAGLLQVLPLALGDAFSAINDTVIRIVLSDFFQEHGFYAAAGNVGDRPLRGVITGYQGKGLHVGAAFVLASVQAFLPGAKGIDVHPAAAAWGVALNVLGLFLLIRWGLGTARLFALLGAFAIAVTPNPMHSAAAHGFLPQTFGTAALMFGLALLGWSAQTPSPDRRHAILLGLSWAFLLSVYVELLPILGLATAAVALGAFFRRAEAGPRTFLRILAMALAVAVLAGNVEILRASSAMPSQVGAVVGGNIAWSWPEFWSFAMGTRIGGFERMRMDRSVGWAVLTVVATVLLILGLSRRAISPGRAPAVVAALGGLLALGAYFALAVRDPWTGLTGHTWSVFKVAQWGFPVALALQSAGLEVISRARRGWIAVGVMALILPLALPAQVGLARDRAEMMQEMARSDHPFEAYRQLAAIVDDRQPSRIYLIDPSGESWPRGLIAYFLGDWPVAYDDDGTAPTGGDPGAAPPLILLTAPPTYGCFEMLPGGVALVEDAPVIVAVRGPGGSRITGRRASLQLQGGRTTLRLWAPRPGVARITAHGSVRSDGSRDIESRLRFETPTGHAGEVSIGDGEVVIDVPVRTGAGDLHLVAARRLELADLEIGFSDAAGGTQACEAG